MEKRKKKICFIVNPFSGVSRKKQLEPKIRQFLDHNQFDYLIKYTERPGHATELAQEAIQQDFDIITAVGGDGSINEVAQALVGTQKVLAILPAGSGNGFAMYLGLGRKIEKAIQVLNSGQVITIDSCTLNKRPYFNLAGVGFDGLIAYKIKNSKIRGLWGYVKLSLQAAFGYQFPRYKISMDGKVIERDCIVVEVANAPMFGYNFLIAPQAKLNDGLLEVVIIKKAPKWRYLFSIWRFFNGSVHKSSLVERYSAQEVKIEAQDRTPVHVDGEGFLTQGDLLFKVNRLSLQVITPTNFKA
ncbi:MAG: diacylglycerol kinase family protein [Bacteroidota bacterium]